MHSRIGTKAYSEDHLSYSKQAAPALVGNEFVLVLDFGAICEPDETLFDLRKMFLIHALGS